MATIQSHVCDHCGASIPRLPSDHFKAFDGLMVDGGDIFIDLQIRRVSADGRIDLCANCLVGALNRAQAQIKAERDNA